LALLQIELPDARRKVALEHVEGCEVCQVLLAGAARALAGDNTSPLPSQYGVFDTGQCVAERYRIERFIARGGMGEVYAAYDQVLDETIALKTLREASPSDAKAIRRLKSEVQLSRKIGHPNTCRIYEFGEHENLDGSIVYFFTMGLVEGETLGARIRRDGPLDANAVTTVARQILGGMAEAHGLGILHRDLKSDNIMLRAPTTAGLVIDAVIMDFGLALRLDSEERLTTDSHALVGSAAYMAPEQVEGLKLTAAADIYAFGVILFEMLTGRLPFRAATPAATALLRLRQRAPVPSSVCRNVDPAWDWIVHRCLERSLESRFGSVREVLVAVDGLASGSAPRGRVWARARAGLSALALLALCVPVLALLRGSRSPSADAAPPVSTVRRAELPAPMLAPGVDARVEPTLGPAAEPPPAAGATVAPLVPAPTPPSSRPPARPHRISRTHAGPKPKPGSNNDPEAAPARTPPAAPPAAVRSRVGPLPIDSEFPK
jgi:serine/threonine protein kinase